jgi:hypothetical protein
MDTVKLRRKKYKTMDNIPHQHQQHQQYQQYQQSNQVFQAIREYICSMITVDKLKVAIYVTWAWAYIGLYFTKIVEVIFKLILSIPNSWLTGPVILCKNITTTQNKKVNILNAYTDKEEITNKLKLFLQYYWENGGNGNAHDKNGFSMTKLTELLNCSLLYCSYILSNDSDDILPETFFQNIQRYLIEKDSENICYMSNEKNMSDRREIFLGHVSFDDEELINQDINLDDMELSDTDTEENNIFLSCDKINKDTLTETSSTNLIDHETSSTNLIDHETSSTNLLNVGHKRNVTSSSETAY